MKMKFKDIETRKAIAIGSFIVVAFIAIYCTVTGKEINQSGLIIVTALIGAINWYFAKSTALDTPKKEKDGEE
jgi:uncharacterized membrane protein